MERFNRQVDETLAILFKILEIEHEPQFSNRTALVVEMFYQAANIHADRTVYGDLYLLFLWESRIFIDYPFIILILSIQINLHLFRERLEDE